MVEITGFLPSREVDDERELFGRGDASRGLLGLICTQLRSGTNIQLLGERRSGKSSLLRCVASVLMRENPETAVVYLNFRARAEIKGRAAAYRHILETLFSQTRGHLGEGALSEAMETATRLNDEEFSNFLATVPDHRLSGLLERAVSALGSVNARAILLIDEYEHFLRQTLSGTPGGFAHIRQLTSQANRVLTFCIAGVESWSESVGPDGSPELNNIGPLYVVGPLELPEFTRMWDHALAVSTEAVRARVLDSGWRSDRAFEAAGGWPFYGKVIGQQLSFGAESDEGLRGALRPHFDHLWQRLDAAERDTLLAATHGHVQVDAPFVIDLVKRGILWRKNDGAEIAGEYWSAFVLDRAREEGTADLLDGSVSKHIEHLDNEVLELRTTNEMLRSELAARLPLQRRWIAYAVAAGIATALELYGLLRDWAVLSGNAVVVVLSGWGLTLVILLVIVKRPKQVRAILLDAAVLVALLLSALPFLEHWIGKMP